MLASIWDFISDFENDKLCEGKFEFRNTGNIAAVLKSFQEKLIHCIANESYLFNNEHIQTELIDLSIDRYDAFKACITLKNVYRNCKDAEEKEILKSVFNSCKRSINLLLRALKKMCEDREKESLLRNKKS